MSERNSDILITGIRRVRPAEAFTDKETTVFSPVSERPAGGWRIIAYESGLHGGFFLQSQDPKAAMLTIPVDRNANLYRYEMGFAMIEDQA